MAWTDFDWGSLIGAGASLWAADQAADASKDAGKQSAAGAQAAIDLSRDIYNDQRSLNMPAYNAGNTARDQYMRMLGLTPPSYSTPTAMGQSYAAPTSVAGWFGEGKDPVVNQQLYGSDPAYKRAWDEVAAFHRNTYGSTNYRGGSKDALASHLGELYAKYQPKAQPAAQAQAAKPQDLSKIYDQWRKTPGYQFGLQEGNRSIEASAAARGGLNSGATLKALQRYGTDYADQQGYQPYMNSLAGLFGGAQQAVGNIGNAGSSYGAQAGQAGQNAANARAQSTYASGQAWANGMDNVAGFLGDWYGNTYGKRGG